ncbi:hypothetical protein DFJ67_3033 [Asanoa ferruginea]|uniref:PknH-like protein n=1 Tax=Asanoa ferruginea TaxID=53367 RepID=A0A3D9ZI11_9ACTN|nr:hypothetical protein [Asanoa ferruginea]REF97038.1 hypothetical protein DFJ67_3033 [Asanoa ferruginea]GIF50530.1 hypothetical protein Afe04nite_50690 [Asanoa ferruginea]
MRDEIDLTQRLATDLGRVQWPAGEEIRKIARRRNRRAAVAASLSVLLLLSGVWVVATRPFQQQQTADTFASAPDATITPGDTEWIPPEALLTPEDVGPGLVATRVSVKQNQPIGAWAFTLAGCPAFAKVPTYQGVYQYRRDQTLEFPPKIPGKPETGLAVLHQSVMRLPGGAARDLVREAVEVTEACPKYSSIGMLSALTGDPEMEKQQVKVETTHVWVELDKGFAGDESVLFEHRITGASPAVVLGTSAIVLVRVGDLVATVEQVNGESTETTRRLAKRAAAWLCTAATPPC